MSEINLGYYDGLFGATNGRGFVYLKSNEDMRVFRVTNFDITKFSGSYDDYIRKDVKKKLIDALNEWYPVNGSHNIQRSKPEESPAEGAVKHDGDKPRYDLLPPELLQAVAEILAFGAEKYAPRNWEKGMNWGRVFAALQRHLWQWFNPLCSDLDEETGKSHLWHAACCLAFLITYEARGIGTDDRPKT